MDGCKPLTAVSKSDCVINKLSGGLLVVFGCRQEHINEHHYFVHVVITCLLLVLLLLTLLIL